MKRTILSALLVIIFLSSISFSKEENQTNIKWKFQTCGRIHSKPIIKKNLVIFGSEDSSLYAINKETGKEVWSYKTNGGVSSAPIIYKNMVIFLSKDNTLYMLNVKDGKLIRKIDGEEKAKVIDPWDYYNSSPVLEGNKIFYGSGDKNIYCINAETGTIYWKYKTDDLIRTTPALNKKYVFCGSMGGIMYALDKKTGELKWKFKTTGISFSPKGDIQSSAALSSNILLFGSRDCNLYALDPESGKLVWKLLHENSWIVSTPVIYKNIILVGSSDAHFFQGVDIKTGKQIWSYPTENNVLSTPFLHNGKVYAGIGNAYSDDKGTGYIVSLNADNGQLVKRYDLPGNIFSSPIVENNILYAGTDDGCLYAIKE